MPGKTKTNKSNEAYYKTYNAEKQRTKRIERHLKKHPEDKQSLEKL